MFDSINDEPEPMVKDPTVDEVTWIPPFKMNLVIHDRFYGKPKSLATQEYKRVQLSRSKQIRVLQNAFAFRNNRNDRENHGFKSGSLDLNGLHKLAIGDISVFDIKESPKNKKVTIGILLDQSGSMNNTTADGSLRYIQAREVVITLVEALRTTKGVELVIYGHSADIENTHDLDMFPYQDKACKQSNLEHLASAMYQVENADGFAIKYIADRMIANNPINKDSIHTLFILTDGRPCARNYNDEQAQSHTLSVVKEVIKRGQKVFAIGIDNAFSDDTGDRTFGKNNYIVIKDIQSSVNILAREIKKLLSK